MIRKNISKRLAKIAAKNGYNNTMELLMDYGFVPTVMMPKHKKFEIVRVLLKTR